MAIEVTTERSVCTRCGVAYGRRKGYFPVSYAILYKGIGYIPVCKECIDSMYNGYLAQCKDPKLSVRQMCRKLDLFWSEDIYDMVLKKNTTRTMMTQYIAKINSITYAGKSYDDTLSIEGTLWSFENDKSEDTMEQGVGFDVTAHEQEAVDIDDVPEEVRVFWGVGYTPDMYIELEQRRAYWMSRFPEGIELDVGTEAIIRQICSLEIDINRGRAAGKAVDKSITALNGLLGSANLKPNQKKQEDVDSALANTPMGVWLYRYENQRPLPDVDDDLKDVNGLRKYVFTWMGHLCKMLGIKNTYSQLYEDEVARLRVEKPEYDGDDEDLFLSDTESEDE